MDRLRINVWLIVWMLLLATLLIPLIWLVIAKQAGITLVSAHDPNSLIATVGGIMGAIFVVGGLVIALSSLVTLFSVEERIESRLNRLVPELRRDADSQIGSYVKFLEAREAYDWREAERLTELALQSYDHLPDARRILGLKLSKEVTAYFNEEHRNVNLALPVSYTHLTLPTILRV